MAAKYRYIYARCPETGSFQICHCKGKRCKAKRVREAIKR